MGHGRVDKATGPHEQATMQCMGHKTNDRTMAAARPSAWAPQSRPCKRYEASLDERLLDFDFRAMPMYCIGLSTRRLARGALGV